METILFSFILILIIIWMMLGILYFYMRYVSPYDFIIKKISNGQFDTLEAWKKHWYKEVYDKAQNGFTTIEINGRSISTYAELKSLFDEAVQKDLDSIENPNIKNHYKNTEDLKWKVYKQLLQKSDGFSGNLFAKASL